ncbi:hypothetical protein Tco_0481579 [Tanacetum coccineum]
MCIKLYAAGGVGLVLRMEYAWNSSFMTQKRNPVAAGIREPSLDMNVGIQRKTNGVIDPELKNPNHGNQAEGTGAHGLVHALGGGEADQDLNDMEDDIREVRFGKRGKLNPRYVGPFKVLEKVGSVAYKLELPQELSNVHNTFHVSNLKKCYADEPLVIPLDGLHFDDKL